LGILFSSILCTCPNQRNPCITQERVMLYSYLIFPICLHGMYKDDFNCLDRCCPFENATKI
jgi:hypothetical protein